MSARKSPAGKSPVHKSPGRAPSGSPREATPRPAADDTAPVLPLAAWRIACAEVDRVKPPAACERTWTATEAECAAIAGLLELTACRSLSATVAVRPRGAGRYWAKGRLLAVVDQACVATLDPISSSVNQPFEGEFCPASELEPAGPHDPAFDPDGEDEPIAIVDDQVDIGQLVFEHLALAIDPFPRTADTGDITLEKGPQGAPPIDAQKPNPFAALARLKPSP